MDFAVFPFGTMIAKNNRSTRRSRMNPNRENPHHARKGKDMNDRICYFIYDEDGNKTTKYCYSKEKAEEIIDKLDRKERRAEREAAEERAERYERPQTRMPNEIPNLKACQQKVEKLGLSFAGYEDIGPVQLVVSRPVQWSTFDDSGTIKPGTYGRLMKKNNLYRFFYFHGSTRMVVFNSSTHRAKDSRTSLGSIEPVTKGFVSSQLGPELVFKYVVKTRARSTHQQDDDDFDMSGLTWETE